MKIIFFVLCCFLSLNSNLVFAGLPSGSEPKEASQKISQIRCRVMLAIAVVGAFACGYSCNTSSLGERVLKEGEFARANLSEAEATRLINRTLLTMLLTIESSFKDETQLQLRHQTTAELENYVQTETMTADEILLTKIYIQYLANKSDFTKRLWWDVGTHYFSSHHYQWYSSEHFDDGVYKRILDILQFKKASFIQVWIEGMSAPNQPTTKKDQAVP